MAEPVNRAELKTVVTQATALKAVVTKEAQDLNDLASLAISISNRLVSLRGQLSALTLDAGSITLADGLTTDIAKLKTDWEASPWKQ